MKRILKNVFNGKRTGGLDAMLLETEMFNQEEETETLDQITIILQSIMLVVIAIIAAMTLLAIMLPMVSIIENIFFK